MKFDQHHILYGFTISVNLLCMAHGGSVVSGLRSVVRNKSVGGKADSKHLTGLAVDVVLDTMSPLALESFISAAHRVGLIAVSEGDHVHIQIP